MTTVNKEGIVRRLNVKTGEGLAKSHAAVEKVFETITDILLSGQDVRIQGFGTFRITRIKERTINVPTTENKLIPEHTGIKFRISKKLKDDVKNVQPCELPKI